MSGQIAGLEIRLIAKLCHGFSYTFLGFLTDGWIILAGSGNSGRGHPGQSCHIFDGYCHKICLLMDMPDQSGSMPLIRLFYLSLIEIL